MTHLSPEELTAWFQDGRAADRERVVGHLSECESCRKALAMMAVAAEPALSSPVVRVEEAVPRGYAFRPAAEQRQWAWLRPVYALAGAAAVIVAVVWITAPGPSEVQNVVRSAELTAQSPAGVTNSLEFTWASPLQASRYRVTVRDAAGALVFAEETTASSLTADVAIRGKLATMVDYSWTVSALDPAGNVIAESRPRSFTYQP